jgi:AraC-like DNA-binding protein
MNLGKEILFFFSALGSFNGFIFSIYFFFFSRSKKLSNYFLASLLLALSLRIGKSVLVYFDSNLSKLYLQIGLSACWFIGPSLYYYLKSEKLQLKKIPKRWVVELSLLTFVIVTIGLLFPYPSYPAIWNQYIVFLIYTQWVIFLFLSGTVIKNVFGKIGAKEDKLSSSEIWSSAILFGNIIIFATYAWALLGKSRGAYISGAVSFSFILYLVLLALLYRKKNDDLFSQSKNPIKKITDDDASLIIRRLEHAMVEKGLYKNPNIKLNDLANEINTSQHQLSQLLNDHLGKNFTLFINEYRIAEACQLLSTKSHLTIEAIGEEVGFNSKSTFFSSFKKLKGSTPAVYQQENGKV